jgi:hypothetical protein
MRQLDSKRSHTSGGPVNEHPLIRRQLAVIEKRLPGR